MLVAWSLIFIAACGSDYSPPSFETTGVPAEPLGPVLDLDVSLPNLFVQEAGARGLTFTMRMEVDEAGLGSREARYFIGDALADMGLQVEVEDLGRGITDVLMTPDAWTTGRIGPLRVGVITFEMLLDGVPENEGRMVSGDTWENQTGLKGPFSGWARHRFLVAGSDFASAGRVTEVSLVREGEIIVRKNLESISPDPILRRTGRSIFVVNRLSYDNLQRLDPRQDFATAWQAGMGVGANPHDVALLTEGAKAYVTRYEPPFNDVAVLNPESGAILDTVPMTGLLDVGDPTEDTPRADRLAVAEGLVFVALQYIDRSFSRFGEGRLAIIDPLLDEVVGTIPLGGKNPGFMEVVAGADGRARIYVALAGIFPGLLAQELSGGVVVVDVTNRAVERLALDDDDAGGNIAALALVSEELGYVVVSDDSFSNRVMAFRPDTGEILRAVFESTDLISEIEVDAGGVLAIPDRSFTRPQVCLYRVPANPEGAETPMGCGDLDLAPFSLEALD